MNSSAFIPTQFVVQLENTLQPPQWGVPALLCGVHVIVDDTGTTLYQPAYTQRPAAGADITDDYMQAINAQLAKVGLQLSKVV